MNNFITNIKRHKLIALGCLGALLLAVVILILVSSRQQDNTAAPEDTSLPEPRVFFLDDGYSVYLMENGHDLSVRIASETPSELPWRVFVLPGETPLTDNVTEKDNQLYLELKPLQTGYATICFVKEHDVAGVSCEDVRIEIEVYTAANEEDELCMYFSNIHQRASSSGAMETNTPFILDKNRVIFPSGGDWTLSEEEDHPEGFYGFLEETDENGIRYIIVTKNVDMVSLSEQSGGEISTLNPENFDFSDYRLVLRSEALGVSKLLSCQMGEDREWVLTVTEEEYGKEN